jgi:hypothetical protein
MSNATAKVRMVAAVAALFLLIISGGCKGFFVNQPDSVSVTTGVNGTGNSTFSVAQGSTTKLFATAAYSSGSKDVTNSAFWSSSSACATVNAGTVTGVGAASNITITATVAAVSGSATGTVTGSSGQSLTISPTSVSLANGTVQFQAVDSSNVDHAASATWTSGNSSILTFASSTGGQATLVAQGTVTVSASLASGNSCESGSASVTVGP